MTTSDTESAKGVGSREHHVNSGVAVSRLPVRVRPIAGEAIDSWLEVIANVLDQPLGALLPMASRSGQMCRSISPDQVAVLTQLTGMEAADLAAMTLGRYVQPVVMNTYRPYLGSEWSLFGALLWSRYCPECLAESGGRWQLSWRLAWSFACVTHGCILLDRCPGCGAYQRQTCLYGNVPQPGICRCGYRLRDAAAVDLPDEHPYLAAQVQILEVVATGQAGFGVYGERPEPVSQVLQDIKRFAAIVVDNLETDGRNPESPAKSGLSVAGAPPVFPARKGVRAPVSVFDAAEAMTTAIDILSAADVMTASWRAQRLFRREAAETVYFSLRCMDFLGTTHGEITLRAIGPWLRPALHLQHGTELARRYRHTPCLGLDAAREVARFLPSELWLEWSRRLLLDSTVTEAARAALSCAVLLCGREFELPRYVTQALGSVATQKIVDQTLQALYGSTHWHQVCVALDRLNGYLSGHDVPIDYRRRRRLSYGNALSEDDWVRMCSEAGQDAGRGRRIDLARCLLIRRLSGMPPEFCRDAPAQAGTPRFDRQCRAFADTIDSTVSSLLDEHGRRFLIRRRVDEPLLWQPPLSLIDDLELP